MNPSYKTIQQRYSYSARHKSDTGLSGIVKRHDIEKAKEYSAKSRALKNAKKRSFDKASDFKFGGDRTKERDHS